ncbi:MULTISPECIES: hypothetical protein [Bacillus]|uniref:hypothetical protein n=1 Tax=Bacillus TaxID=1386 RepID=UPI0006A5750F|nr:MULTISPECIES: hypothetical protein [Bacillus]KOC80076.1 hypothetical protein AKJ10_16480 [Bacillus velezensis]KSW04644.1 hypothetical protein AR442_16505 [Bacillus velezensis]MBT9287623.1 hypothetical protein [Bacillus velezensis]MCX2824175.1 hypothetical protein [Bacillus sp. H1F1]MDY7906204.1 hypothetical protein [Bacillus sp. AG1]
MEWSKVFDLLKTILTSWPLAAVVIVFAIRKSLKTVIENRLFSFKVGNVEIIFDRLLEKVDQSLQEASQRSEEEKVDSETMKEAENTKTEKFEYKLPETPPSIVKESNDYSYIVATKPRLLVKESWREVERKIRSLVIESGGNDFRFKHPKNSMIYLTKEYPQLGKALKSLLELRNFLLNENYELKSVDATIFRSRCLSAIDELNKYMEKSNVAN